MIDIRKVYKKIYAYFGKQYWWPAESAFEVIIGAILTQNTSWSNVEKAISNLKAAKVLTPERLYRLRHKQLARALVPSGYYNLKAKRIKSFLEFFFKKYQGNLKKMSRIETMLLRQELLRVKGIGPETADSILLYALAKPVFVVDAYTKRIFSRHQLFKEDISYAQAQSIFMRALKKDVKVYNEYHALLVRLAKEFCLKNNPRCKQCPLK